MAISVSVMTEIQFADVILERLPALADLEGPRACCRANSPPRRRGLLRVSLARNLGSSTYLDCPRFRGSRCGRTKSTSLNAFEIDTLLLVSRCTLAVVGWVACPAMVQNRRNELLLGFVDVVGEDFVDLEPSSGTRTVGSGADVRAPLVPAPATIPKLEESRVTTNQRDDEASVRRWRASGTVRNLLVVVADTVRAEPFRFRSQLRVVFEVAQGKVPPK